MPQPTDLQPTLLEPPRSTVATPPAPQSFWYDTVPAAFRMDNTVVNAIEMVNRPAYQPQVGYDVLPQLQSDGLTDQADMFVGVRSPAEYNWKKNQIQQEMRDRQTMAAAGWGGVVADLAAGNLDPTMFIPFVNPAKGLKGLLLSISSVASLAATQEAALQASQATRTAEETAYAVGGAAVLGGVFHGVSHLIHPTDMERMAYKVANATEQGVSQKAASGMEDTITELDPVSGTFVVRKNAGSPEGVFDATGRSLGQQNAVEIRPDKMLVVTPDSLPLIEKEMGKSAPTREEILAWAKGTEHDAVAFEGFDNSPQAVMRETQAEYGGLRQVGLHDVDPKDRQLILDSVKQTLEKTKKDLEPAKLETLVKETQTRLLDRLEREKVAVNDIAMLRLRGVKDKPYYDDGVHVLDMAKVTHGEDVTGQSFDPVRFGRGVAESTVPQKDPVKEAGIQAASAGAAASAPRSAGGLKAEGRLRKKVIKAFARTNPVARTIAQNISKYAREGAALFADSGLTRELNAEDIASAAGGTIQDRINTWRGVRDVTNEKMLDLFRKYALGKDTLSLADKLRARLPIEGKLSEKAFYEEVSVALEAGQKHVIPEVVQAATIVRKDFLDPLWKELVDTGIMDAKDRLENYLSRDYDRDKILNRYSDFLDVLEENANRLFREMFLEEFGSLKSASERDKQYIADVSKPMPEVRASLEKIKTQLAGLEQYRPEDVKIAEENIADLRSRARDAKDPAEKKSLLAEARRLDKEAGPAFAQTKTARAALRRERRNLNKSRAMFAHKQEQKLAKLERGEELQMGSLNRAVRSAQKFLKEMNTLSDKELTARIKEVRNRFETASTSFDNGELAMAKILAEEPDLQKVMKADEILQAKKEKATEFANEWDNLTGMDRTAARAAVQKEMDDMLRKVNDLNSRRAVRNERLAQQAEGLDPKLVDASIKERERVIKERELAFRDRWRTAGADTMDLATGSADFTTQAKQVANDIARKIMNQNVRLGNMDVALETGPVFRGLTAKRVLDIPFEKIKPFLELDITRLMGQAVRTAAPDVEIAKKFGSPTAKELFDNIALEHTAQLDNIRASNKSVEEKAKAMTLLDKQYASFNRDLLALVNRARHRLDISHDPNSWMTRAGEVMQHLNTLRFLGQVVISSLPDIFSIVLRNGLLRTWRDGFLPLIRMTREQRFMSRREARYTGTLVDAVNQSFGNVRLGDIVSGMGRRSKFEKSLTWASSKMGTLALFDQWTNLMKQVTSTVTVARVMDSMDLVLNNTGSAAERRKATEYLASLNMTGNAREEIWRQITLHSGGEKVNGVWFPNTEKWDVSQPNVKEALTIFRAAVGKAMNDTIVTPGLERPLTFDKPWAKILFQFQSFAMSSTAKTMMAGIQASDAAAIQGVLGMLGLGALSTYLRAVSVGGTTYEKMKDQGASWWASEAIKNSGVMGIVGSIYGQLQRVPAIGPLFGGDPVFRGGDTALVSNLGPSADLVQRLFDILGSMRDKQGLRPPSAHTVHLIRQLMPLQNTIGIRYLHDLVEKGVVNAFGLPERARR